MLCAQYVVQSEQLVLQLAFVYDFPASLNIAAFHVSSRALSNRTSISASLICKFKMTNQLAVTHT